MAAPRKIPLLLAVATMLTTTGVARAFDPGLVDHPLGVVDFRHLPETQAAGARWHRVPAEWQLIEPEDDQFNWETTGFSGWLEQAEALGINLSPLVTVGQMWATGFPDAPASSPSHPPTDLQETFDPLYGYSRTYYDFISSFLDHYRSRIDRISIENEVNTRNFWVGDMDDYRRLLATAVKARDDVAPEVLILDSGLGSGSWGAAIAEHMIESGERAPEEILRFANDWYEHDEYAPFHWDSYVELVYWLRQPYVQQGNATVNFVLRTAPGYVDALNFKFTSRHWLLPTLIDYFELRMGEAGYSLPPLVNHEASNWPLGDPVLEGRNLFKMVIIGLSRGVVRHLWFPWSNQDTTTPRRGLLDESGNITRQYEAFLNISERLGTRYRFFAHDTLGTSVLRFRFLDETEEHPRVEAMWWDDGTHGSGSEVVTIPLPPGTESVIRYTYNGVPATFPGGEFLDVSVGPSGNFFEYVPAEIAAPAATPPVDAFLASAPNPFRRSSLVRFRLPGSPDEMVAFELAVFDAAGRRVRLLDRGSSPPEERAIAWDGRDDAGRPAATGSYWVRLSTPRGSVVERVTLTR